MDPLMTGNMDGGDGSAFHSMGLGPFPQVQFGVAGPNVSAFGGNDILTTGDFDFTDIEEVIVWGKGTLGPTLLSTLSCWQLWMGKQHLLSMWEAWMNLIIISPDPASRSYNIYMANKTYEAVGAVMQAERVAGC